MRLAALVVLLFSAGAPPASAADNGAWKGAAAYLNYAPSARSVAMGQADSAAPSDASAVWSNPAGLSLLASPSVATASGLLGLDRSLYFVGVAYPMSFKYQSFNSSFSVREVFPIAIAAGLTNYGVGGIDGRDDFGGRQSSFQDVERSLYVSMGMRPTDWLAMGMTWKRLTQNLANASAEGTAYDAGFLLISPEKYWGQCNLSFVSKDIGGSLNWKVPDDLLGARFDYEERVESKLVIGGSYATPGKRWRLSLDAVQAQHQQLAFHVGSEFVLYPGLRLRTGMNAYDPTFGIGIDHAIGRVKLALDYAFQYSLDSLHSPNWVGLNLFF